MIPNRKFELNLKKTRILSENENYLLLINDEEKMYSLYNLSVKIIGRYNMF